MNESNSTVKTEYNTNNMVFFFKEYQGACIELNQYQSETNKLTRIDYLFPEDPFTDVKDNIVTWLADMAKAGLINEKDSSTVDSLLSSAYKKINLSAIEKKIEELNDVATHKLNKLQKSFDEAPEKTGYLTKILRVQITGLSLDKVEIINKIFEKEGIHLIKNYYDNGSKKRGNFDTIIYADNKNILSDIQDEITIASLKHNFKGCVNKSEILTNSEAFRLMTNMRSEVMIGSHIEKIIKPVDMQYVKQKQTVKPNF